MRGDEGIIPLKFTTKHSRNKPGMCVHVVARLAFVTWIWYTSITSDTGTSIGSGEHVQLFDYCKF